MFEGSVRVLRRQKGEWTLAPLWVSSLSRHDSVRRSLNGVLCLNTKLPRCLLLADVSIYSFIY